MKYTTKKILLLFFLATVSLATKAQVQAGFNIIYQTPNCAPGIVTFQNTSTGNGLTYQWNFGVAPGVNSTLSNPATTYLTCGTYTVSLTATNSSNQSNTITQSVTVNCSPVASFSVNVTSGCNPLSVQFTNTSNPGTGTISNYLWDFGDGSQATSANPLHVYTTSGCKTVTLLVTNSNGCISDTTMTNVICVTLPPVVSFTSNPNPATACAVPFTVGFTQTVTGGTPPYSYHWIFAGGAPSTSTSANPSSTFNTPGYHSVTLVVTDANGCMDTLTIPHYVFVGNYNSSFTLSADTGCAPFAVSASGPGNGVASWSWTALGSVIPSSTSQSPNFIYTIPGTYQICLTTTFVGGCTVSNCSTVVVHSRPTANFTSASNLTLCQTPAIVNYQNTSSGIGPLTYSWTFPGGSPTSSTAMNPPAIHYNNCGNFDAVLTVTNQYGCSDTKSMINFVNINCPVAQFTSNTTGGCVPATINFNSTASFGNPVQWHWNFGTTANPNLIQSSAQNPSFTFTTPGCYTVSLVIINALGCTDTVSQTNYICVGTPPTANFTAFPLTTCAFLGVNFTNTSTNTFPYTTWSWDFENLPFSSQSLDQNPSHNYSDTGWFDVTLVACNFGCCDTLTLFHYIHILPPIAVMQSSSDCASPLDYSFDGSTSIGATSYHWTFPGGTPATSTAAVVNNVHWSVSGDYVVLLSVYNSQTGCYDSVSKIIRVRNVQANFTCPQSGCAALTVHFSNTSVDAVGYKWNIFNSAGSSIWQSFVANPVKVLSTPGVYSVRLIATDINGCKDTLYLPNYITVYGFVVSLSTLPYSPCAPSLVQFNSNLVSGNSIPVTYTWNFGDPTSGANNTSGLVNPTHLYLHDGNYAVSLNVLDNHGCNSAGSLTNHIVVHKPVVNFHALDTTICVNSQACFFNTSVGTNLVYNWNFGNGQVSNQGNPCIAYNNLGFYTVSLMATDVWGCKDTLIKPNYIEVIQTVASFTVDTTTSNCPPLPVHFTSTSTGVDAGTTYQWSFGDGATSTLMNPFHIYTFAGVFDVSLIVTNSNGCTDTMTMDSLITIGGPMASVTTTLSGTCNPITVCFQAISNSVSFTWNFGDGTVLNNGQDTACHTYTSSGTFNPQVILSDGQGCTYTYQITTINLDLPIAGFTHSPNDICQSGTVQFTDTSYSGMPIVSTSWNFGDPSSGALDTSSVQNPSHFYSAIGSYIVSFSIVTSVGCTASITDTIFVTPKPTAAFAVNDSTVCPGTSIQIINNSSSVSAISSYSWNFGDVTSGANNTSSVTAPNHIFDSSGQFVISLIITSVNGCSDTAQNPVTIFNLPPASAGSPVSECLGDSAQLNASGGVSFVWTPATNLTNANVSNPYAFPSATSTYTVQVTDINGCVDTSSVVVNVNALPTITVTGSDTICYGAGTQLNASGGINYTWSPASTLSSGIIANPVASPFTTTIYTVMGSDSNGCRNTAQVLVSLFPQGTANGGPDINLCIGDSVQLAATGGVSYIWSPAFGLSDSTVFNPICHVVSTTTYTVTTIDQFNCPVTDPVVVFVKPLPTVDAGANGINCFGSSTMIGANGATTYVWSPATWLSSAFVSNPICSATSDITYHVIGTDAFGCKNSDSVSIHVQLPFNAKVTNDTALCAGGTVQLDASGSDHYTWIPAIWLTDAHIANPVSHPQSSVTYQVIVADNVCFTDTQTVKIIVDPLPVVDAGQDQSILAGEVATLNANGTGIGYIWSPGTTLSCTECQQTNASPEYTTTYNVETVDSFGCRASDSVIIRVICHDNVVYIPNAFTPNHDNKNDEFSVRSVGLKAVISFKVFDRWGALLFETDQMDDGWDGTYKNQELAPGVFVYTVEAICSTGDIVKLQGNVTLIR